MNQFEINQSFALHECKLTKHLMDERLLNNQMYMVVSFSGNKFFDTKIKLEKYLVSLAPNFIYNMLSELVLYLIENEIIIDSTITK